MKYKLVSKISPTISIYADEYQYILIIKATPSQSLTNARHCYFQTLASCFEEIMSHVTKVTIADGKDKTIKDIAIIMKNIVEEVRTLLKPFEEI